MQEKDEEIKALKNGMIGVQTQLDNVLRFSVIFLQKTKSLHSLQKTKSLHSITDKF